MGIKTVAVYSTADRDSLHVRFADEAVCVGPPPSRLSYLNTPQLIAAAELTNAQAIHPGYGFLSENAAFAGVCGASGIRFIGPTPEAISQMGDKATAKATMQRAGVPTIPGSEKILASMEEGMEWAQYLGYPVLLKATAGGGGKGMKVVSTPQMFKPNWEMARREAKAAFDHDGLYLEKLIEAPRHIEIQILADHTGHACHLSERDCSIQRRHQKLVEETPSPAMTPELREKMGKTAIQAVEFIGYEGVGTVEFLVDQGGNFYFMEMNTRIQVEHPVTEEVTQLDLIKEQLKMAAGEKICGQNHFPQGCAIECRINAEDPASDFRPCPGTIKHLHWPGGVGVRVDTHIYAGYTISPHYDSLLAKLVVRGQSREEAICRMQRALGEVVIEGVKTTVPLHRCIANHPMFRSGQYATDFLEHLEVDSCFESE